MTCHLRTSCYCSGSSGNEPAAVPKQPSWRWQSGRRQSPTPRASQMSIANSSCPVRLTLAGRHWHRGWKRFSKGGGGRKPRRIEQQEGVGAGKRDRKWSTSSAFWMRTHRPRHFFVGSTAGKIFQRKKKKKKKNFGKITTDGRSEKTLVDPNVWDAMPASDHSPLDD